MNHTPTTRTICALASCLAAIAGCHRASGAGDTGAPKFLPAIPQNTAAEAAPGINAPAWTLLRDHKLPAALTAFTKAAQDKSLSADDRADADLGIGACYLTQRKYDQARAAFAAGKTLRQVNPQEHFKIDMAVARSFAQQKKLPEARAAYTATLAKPLDAPARVEALNGLAGAYQQAGDFEGARQTLAKIVADPASGDREKAGGQLSIAQTYVSQNNPARAKLEFARVLAMPKLPDDLKIQAEFNLANADVLAKDYPRAADVYNKINTDPAANKTDQATAQAQLQALANFEKMKHK